MRKLSIVLVVALLVATFSVAVLADCGKCPSKAGCAMKAADTKTGCAHGDAKDAKMCCAHQKDMMAAMDALQKDLATMEKGIATADQASFLKAHQANLKKFVDAHAACEKECKMKAETKEAPKAPATKDAPKT